MTGTTRSSDGLDDRRKRILFRCWHRGTREMDLILGRFADAEIGNLSDNELDELERLLEESDPDLYAAITGNKVLPADVTGALFTRIKAYPSADARQCCRRRRRPRHLRSRACHRGAAEEAGRQPCRGLPRRPAHAAARTCAAIFRARFAGTDFPGLGLPAL